MFSVQTNNAANTVLFNMGNSFAAMNKSSTELSSGYKINSAANDAAGLAISNGMGNQITGLNQASQNAQDGLSMLQTMEGGTDTINSMLGRMRQLALQAANDTQTASNRSDIVDELKQLQQEITRTANTTQFNTQTLLTGLASTGISFQVGANKNQTISLKTTGTNLRASGLGITGTLVSSLATSGSKGVSASNQLLSAIDKALSQVSGFLSNVGSVEDRLNYAIQNLGTESNNLTTAQSRILDTNMASTMTQYSQQQVLVQAGMSMLSHANQNSSMILNLLQ
ncbi:flagellin [Alicyclobacillus ferrooxydans]|uniref:Flagellin n=1 Tax=Alicyclobacillus ferrooxydans TaxID=471514 RepID=A0A0P9GT94_9BACL|nr:flagellin [Alicyclobacillus ferrooxydans]KPV44364.1 hypothetical protein AN477_06945 [Alicyclobacillus ferrooxydans]